MKPALPEAVSVVIAEESPDRLERFVALLRAGQITATTTAAGVRDMLGGPEEAAGRVRDVLRAWGDRGPMYLLAEVIATSMAVRDQLSRQLTSVSVVQTGPSGLRGNRTRSTRAVLTEIVRAAHASLLFVGYSVTTDLNRRGANYLVLDEFVRAARRGVAVTFIVHGDPRNRSALLEAWPSTLPRPPVFTRPVTSDDEKASLHAKLVVADRTDALVTSANLTYHGLEANLELGVRIQGPEAGEIVDHFGRLIQEKELVAWEGGNP